MAIADLDAYKVALTSGREVVPIQATSSAALSTGRSYDLWVNGVPAGAAPTTAVIPDSSTVGALVQTSAGGGLQNSIIGHLIAARSSGTFIIADRLAHSGGLSGTSATAQTTNLPTPALTRYTSGVGVMIGLSIYSSVGSTARTVSATYTNQAGTGSCVTPDVAFGGSGDSAARRMILLPLASGDTGVRSVESVTLSASTGTAGNFGVTLFRPLYALFAESLSGVSAGGFITGMSAGGVATIESGACLFSMFFSSSTAVGGGAVSGSLLIAEN